MSGTSPAPLSAWLMSLISGSGFSPLLVCWWWSCLLLLDAFGQPVYLLDISTAKVCSHKDVPMGLIGQLLVCVGALWETDSPGSPSRRVASSRSALGWKAPMGKAWVKVSHNARACSTPTQAYSRKVGQTIPSHGKDGHVMTHKYRGSIVALFDK